MIVIGLPAALAALMQAIKYIRRYNAAAALVLLDEINQQTEMLARQPFLGRPGLLAGTRESRIGHSRYCVIYNIRRRLQRVEIRRLLHCARGSPA